MRIFFRRTENMTVFEIPGMGFVPLLDYRRSETPSIKKGVEALFHGINYQLMGFEVWGGSTPGTLKSLVAFR